MSYTYKYIQNPNGYIVFEDGGTNPISYGASEKWFSTYDEAIAYAMDIVKNRTEEFKNCIDCNSVIVYEGDKALLHKTHSSPCGRAVFNWNNWRSNKS